MDAPPKMSHVWRVLRSQHAAYMRDPLPNLLVYPDPEKYHVWYWMVAGLEAPHQGGEYLFCLTAGEDFPKKPPQFEFLTGCGVYQPGGPICISVGEFHADDKPGKTGAYGWRPSLGMRGFAMEVVNGLINPEYLESGIRLEILAPALRANYAAASRGANARQSPGLAAAFDRILADRPDSEPCRNALAARGGPRPAQATQPAPVPAAAQAGADFAARRAPAMRGEAQRPCRAVHVPTGFVAPALEPDAGEKVGMAAHLAIVAGLPPGGAGDGPLAEPPGEPEPPAAPAGMTDAEVEDLLGGLL